MFIEDMWSISSYMQSEQPYAIGVLLLIYFNDGWDELADIQSHSTTCILCKYLIIFHIFLVCRPGRLEVQIEISLPDENGRLQILQIHTNKMKESSFLAPDVNLQELGMCKSDVLADTYLYVNWLS